MAQVGRRDASERPAVDAYLATKPKVLSTVAKYCLSVFSNVVRIRHGLKATAASALAPGISAIIPAHHIDVLLKEEAEVVSVRVVDHMLVEHRIGIADNERWQLLEILLSFEVCLIKLLTRRWKEHCVDLRFRSTILIVLDPYVLSVKCRCKDLAHLFVLAENRSEAAAAGGTAAEAPTRLQDSS